MRAGWLLPLASPPRRSSFPWRKLPRMKRTFVFLAIAALGNVTYHLGQKNITRDANPMVLLMAVYAVAFVACGALAPFFPGGVSLGQVARWPVLVLAGGVVLVEIGFVLAYRSGEVMQWSGAAVNGAAALLLIPLAVFAFGESFSWTRFAGIVCTLAGLGLLARDG
jgi:drug/metabolite transporter (DMT)-like permease